VVRQGNQAAIDDIEISARLSGQGSRQGQNIGAAIDEGIQELPREIVMGVLLVELRSPLGKSVNHPAEPRSFAARDGVFVQPIQHFKGRLVIHELIVVQRSQEYSLARFAVLGIEFFPDRIPFQL
jgi:hypothetical protein